MSASQTPQPTNPAPGRPFVPFTDTKGDLFLVTSHDPDTLFQVSRHHLSYVSEAFAGMFGLAQPPSSLDGTRAQPVILPDSDARTFDSILRLVYPCPRPLIHKDIKLFVQCLHFARRYCMDPLTPIFVEIILHPSFLARHPFSAYAAACFLSLQSTDPASYQTIVTATLPRDIKELESVDSRVFDMMDGRHFYALMNLHRKKLLRISGLLKGLSGRKEFYFGMGPSPGPNFDWSSFKCKCNDLRSTSSHTGTTHPSHFSSAGPAVPPRWALQLKACALSDLTESPVPATVEKLFSDERLGGMELGAACGGCVEHMRNPYNRSKLETLRKSLMEVFSTIPN